MAFPRLAIVGMGRMGTAVAERARAQGWEPIAMVSSSGSRTGSGISQQSLNEAEVAIEFSVPGAAAANVRALLDAGCAVVSGTTGWGPELEALARELRASGGALLHSPNFSLGAAVLALVAERASALLGSRGEFQPHIVETHHAAKLDAPSGTAAMLGRAMGPAFGAAIPITSIRLGAVPGTHSVIFDAPFEQLRFEHDVRDRRVFADGALAAARWIVGRSGVFGMRDLLLMEKEDEQR
jgi:4-hydroxy-tetrahydrodipicolinate reductase